MSRSFMSSDISMPYASRTAENVSACLTVSTPRSASISRSSSNISSGYPVCSATRFKTRSSTSSRPPDVDVDEDVDGCSSGSGTGSGAGAGAVRFSTASPSTNRNVRSATSSTGAASPLTSFNHAPQRAGSAMRWP